MTPLNPSNNTGTQTRELKLQVQGDALTPELVSWFSDKDTIRELRSVISNPVFREALRLARGIINRPVEVAVANPIEVAALSHAESQGVVRILEAIDFLAYPPSRLVNDDPQQPTTK